MNNTIKTAVSIAAGLLMLGAVACQSAPASPAPSEVPNESISQTLPAAPPLPPQGVIGDILPVPPLPPTNIDNNTDANEAVELAIVSGSVAYRERIALTPDAVIEIKLIDVSRADAPALTLGEQVIPNPGQVPAKFEIEYNPADIDDRFSYAISARITDGGRLMFLNTSRYAVLTRGNPDTVDMVLQMVGNPEPKPVPPTTDPQELADNVQAPAPIEKVEVVKSETDPDEYTLLVTSGLPSGCAKFNAAEMTRDGNEINVTVTNLMPAPGAMMPCTMIYGYHESDIALGNDFNAGETYNVTVNGELAASFKIDETANALPEKVEALAPIEKTEVARNENNEYILSIVSGLPGGCAEFDNAEMTRDGNEINVAVTNLVPGPEVMMPCTAIYGYHESSVNLGSDFNAGETYNVTVNGELAASFVAQAPEAPAMAKTTSPIENIEIAEGENNEYVLTVVSRLPLGSSCSKFDGYTVKHRGGAYIEVEVTHLEVIPSDGPMICTADLPVVMTEISLGNDFEAGETYTVKVNGEHTETFIAG